MFSISHRGSKKTETWLVRLSKIELMAELNKYGRQGVAALAAATPVESTLSATSWTYEVKKTSSGYSLAWLNTNVTSQGTPVVILLQYGHGTGTGGYVQGRDFINPALRPIFDNISKGVQKAVTSA